jgi:transcriptional regulator with XRE-family HTH domain
MAEPRRSDMEAIRKSRGLKRTALAKRVGCSYKHIWGIERGGHPASEELLRLIANELGVAIDVVMVTEQRGAA